MRDHDMGMGFYMNGAEVGHVSGVLPIPRVGEVVNLDGALLGRVVSVTYNFRHIDGQTASTVILGVAVALEPV